MEHRGKVFLKGKGEVDSFWLVGKDGFSRNLPSPPGPNAYVYAVLSKSKRGRELSKMVELYSGSGCVCRILLQFARKVSFGT